MDSGAVAAIVVGVIFVLFICCVVCACDNWSCFKPTRFERYHGEQSEGCCYGVYRISKESCFSCLRCLSRCGPWIRAKCRRTKTTDDSISDLKRISDHLINIHPLDSTDEDNETLNRDLESAVGLLIKHNRDHFDPPSKIFNPFFNDSERCKAKVTQLMKDKRDNKRSDRIPDNPGPTNQDNPGPTNPDHCEEGEG